MNYIKIPIPAACVALLMLLFCPLHASANEKVRLQLKWPHHYTFAGYYAAKEKGFYQAAGLDVEFVPNFPGEDSVQKVIDGKAQFGVGATDLMLRREQGEPVVVLAVIFQQSSHDLAGRKVKIESGKSDVPAKLAQSFRAEDLAAGTIDGMCTNDGDVPPGVAKYSAKKVDASAGSLGADFYGDNLFTTDSQIKRNPEMVRAFRAASLKGWEYALMHPEEMVQLIHSRYNQHYSIEHLRFEAREIESLLQTPLVQIGHMSPKLWRHIATVYADLGMMERDFDFEGFLYEPRQSPADLKWFYVGFVAAMLLLLAAIVIALRFFRLSTTLKSTITDYKRVGNALLESESLYRSILLASPDGITITDIGGNIKMISPTGVKMFGYEREEEMLRRNIIEFAPPEERERVLANIQGLFLGVSEYIALRADGSTFDIETNGQCLFDADGHVTSVVYVVRDITERKQAGNSCRAAMGEMISAIAHQWRQPLSTLGMIVQRTHAVGTMQGLTETYLEEFKANAMRQIRYMSDTIEEFRNFHHPEKLKESFSPLNCVNDAVTLFGSQLTNCGIVVEVQCQGCEGQLADGFPREFKQVILNLFGNARDAIIESRAADGKPEEGRIRVLMSISSENYLIIDIADNGCGIAPDVATRILEPYFTTKEENGGTGLGLYMSRMIIEDSMGGRFRQIQCPEGAAFRIELQLEKSL